MGRHNPQKWLSFRSATTLAALFGFSGTERGVFILMCMMPASVATYLAVEQFTLDFAQDAASLILLSTLLSAVALPIVLSYGF